MIDGDRVVHELVLAATPDEVFAMFTDAGRLVEWIGVSATLDPRPGGEFRFEVLPGQFCEGRYVVVEPPTRLAFTWGWTDPVMGLPPGASRVDVELAPVDGGTRLRLVHSGLGGDARLLHDDGWSRFLSRLTAAVAGLPPGDYPDGAPEDRLVELRERGR